MGTAWPAVPAVSSPHTWLLPTEVVFTKNKVIIPYSKYLYKIYLYIINIIYFIYIIFDINTCLSSEDLCPKCYNYQWFSRTLCLVAFLQVKEIIYCL